MVVTKKSFKKSQRLLKKLDFDTAFNGPSLKMVCRDFVLLTSASPTHDAAKLGLVVSKKVGNSVERNRVKRCVRDVFRNELAAEPHLHGRSLVVIARASLRGKDGRLIHDVGGSFRYCAGKLVGKLLQSKQTSST